MVSLILFSFMQCDAMQKVMQLREKRKQKEQRRHQNVVHQRRKEIGEGEKSIDECIERLSRAEDTTGASIN